MAEAPPRLFTIPAHRAFADALAAGLIAAYPEPMQLARGLVLLPSNRAKRTVRDAFVRASGGGLLLPRLVAIGEAEEGVAAALDPADAGDPVPPAIAPLERRLLLARLVEEEARRLALNITGAEAVRLAGDLARTLDQLLVEEVPLSALREFDPGAGLTRHWEDSLALFGAVLDRWPEELARIGKIDLADRRARLLQRLAGRWRAEPPAGFVCAAGITTAAPAIAGVLQVVAGLPDGAVVLPGLDRAMPEEEWRALGPHEVDPARGVAPRAIESHPQFQLKLLLDRIGAARGDVSDWPAGLDPDHTVPDSGAARETATANAFAPAAFTGRWTGLAAAARRFDGVRMAAFATVADEAQAIALTLRGALEMPERTAALVTPDRSLARRVAAHLSRWGVAVDDSGGRPLSRTPPGTLLTALATAAAERFAPLALLALVKHPLAQAGETRLDWLEAARRLDLALRGPRPGIGLAGIDAHLTSGNAREQAVRRPAQAGWQAMRPVLEPVAALTGGPRPLGALVGDLRTAAQGLCGDPLWSGPAGRAAAELLAELEASDGNGPALFDPAELPALLVDLMDEIAVRPPQGGHPRLQILGLLEARLQTADLVVLGGLNEGTWPALPAPDPWLAPRIRAALGLPGPDRRIGLAAHDFVSAMGAPEVLLTRARRDAKGPALASRFWLRLEAMAGDVIAVADDLLDWTRAFDAPAGAPQPASRPAPMPTAELRPKSISVTEVDRLKADPYAFYARKVLGLGTLDPVDADPSAAWRGTAVHDVLQRWFEQDPAEPAKLREHALAMLADERTHPLVRALWQPRLMEAIDWLTAELTAMRERGRDVLAVERSGAADIAGVKLSGRFDRIDRLSDGGSSGGGLGGGNSGGGGLGIVDYKTGKAPSVKAVAAGYSLQLGLLGAIAEAGGFAGISGEPRKFEYWSLAKSRDGFGAISDPTGPADKDKIPPEDFVAVAVRNFTEAAGEWLTGDAPFTAKLHPEYAPYGDYDQLMRLDEWYGRER